MLFCFFIIYKFSAAFIETANKSVAMVLATSNVNGRALSLIIFLTLFHVEFELTKKQFSSRTKTLAHHLIQSFVPEEVSFEEAHQVGIELCEKILEGKYEYVLATHIDKDHIHNHIIFNSIDVDEGKVYYFYYGSYMNIRNQSDKLCKEHNFSVIDQETQREINEIKRRKFVNWYDWNEDKKAVAISQDFNLTLIEL